MISNMYLQGIIILFYFLKVPIRYHPKKIEKWNACQSQHSTFQNSSPFAQEKIHLVICLPITIELFFLCFKSTIWP
jgi:hypothetical protein